MVEIEKEVFEMKIVHCYCWNSHKNENEKKKKLIDNCGAFVKNWICFVKEIDRKKRNPLPMPLTLQLFIMIYFFTLLRKKWKSSQIKVNFLYEKILLCSIKKPTQRRQYLFTKKLLSISFNCMLPWFKHMPW